MDYTVFVGTDFKNDGVIWGDWMVGALNGEGNVAYLGGPPGHQREHGEIRGLQGSIQSHPGSNGSARSPSRSPTGIRA